MIVRNLLMTGIVCLTTAVTAVAAFVPPTDAQIDAAAADADKVLALLDGASAEQAANVVRAVLAKAASLNLSATDMETLVNKTIAAALATVPAAEHIAFASALGTEIGNSLAVGSQPALLSAIQVALGAGAGAAGEAVVNAFGVTFKAASEGANSRSNEKMAPPPSNLYPGQN